MERCDVLVVGLGPAGAAAATAAARAGAGVLAIERRAPDHAFPEYPEFIPVPLGPNAHAERVVIQGIVGARSLEGVGEEAYAVAGSVVDRGAFDRALVEFSRNAGAQLCHQVTLRGLDADLSLATIEVRGEVRTCHYRALVATDGHASGVARMLGLPVLRTMHTLRYRVPLRMAQTTVDVWLSPRFRGGYGWLMPAGRDAVIATGMDEARTGEALDALHGQLVDAGLVGRTVFSRAAGVVAVGGPRERLAYGNILFAGDAAGLAHPLTGAGIYPAVISGEAAGMAAALWSAGEGRSISGYESRMQGRFGDTLARALERRQPFLSDWMGEAGAVGGTMEPAGWSLVRGAFEA